MTEWTDVMLLSTRYNPYLVVAAAGSAFAGWTTLEILFGGALQRVLPELYLDLLTVALFLLFGAMLYRSAPREEGLDDARNPNGHGFLGDGRTTLLGVPLPSSSPNLLRALIRPGRGRRSVQDEDPNPPPPGVSMRRRLPAGSRREKCAGSVSSVPSG